MNAETGPGLLLSDMGRRMAPECLPQHFGEADLGLIVSCQLAPNSLVCYAAEGTVSPSAVEFGLDIDTSWLWSYCTEPLVQCIRDLVSGFSATSDKSILIVWDRDHLSGLLNVFGLRNFPSEKFDAVFILRNDIFLSHASQSCDTLDPYPQPPTASAHDIPSLALTLIGAGIIPPASPKKKLFSLDLYYTTTIVLPDLTPPPTGYYSARQNRKGHLRT